MGLWNVDGWGKRATRLAEQVIAAINARDFAALPELVTPDVRFIDSMCESVVGREQALVMLERLVAYDPALQIHTETVTVHGDSVLVTGRVSGSRDMVSRRTLWKLSVRGGLLAEWRSFSADNPRPIIRMLMGSGVATAA